ncbi:MAG: triose-phosphate isomerase [Mycoplasmatales bacterium]
MRRVVIAGNWKMNKSLSEAVEFVTELKKENLAAYTSEIMIFAPYVYLTELTKLAEGTKIVIGAQNIHDEENGAYTGEVSADMLRSIGVNHTLIGHSERRTLNGETDKIINKKLKLALAKGITPILCVGEVLVEREEGITEKVLTEQVTNALVELSSEDVRKIIIAYEPVWAIGTGLTASSSDANDACKHVRSVVEKLYDKDVASELVIQYGGSVKPDNVKELIDQSDIDGALVGGASIEVESYRQLLS